MPGAVGRARRRAARANRGVNARAIPHGGWAHNCLLKDRDVARGSVPHGRLGGDRGAEDKAIVGGRPIPHRGSAVIAGLAKDQVAGVLERHTERHAGDDFCPCCVMVLAEVWRQL